MGLVSPSISLTVVPRSQLADKAANLRIDAIRLGKVPIGRYKSDSVIGRGADRQKDFNRQCVSIPMHQELLPGLLQLQSAAEKESKTTLPIYGRFSQPKHTPRTDLVEHFQSSRESDSHCNRHQFLYVIPSNSQEEGRT